MPNFKINNIKGGAYKDPTGDTNYTYDYKDGKWIAYNNGVLVGDVSAYPTTVASLEKAYPGGVAGKSDYVVPTATTTPTINIANPVVSNSSDAALPLISTKLKTGGIVVPETSSLGIVPKSTGWGGVLQPDASTGFNTPAVPTLTNDVAPVVDASGVVNTPAVDTNPYSDAYNQDMALLAQNKKYLQGNTIAQTLLNVANLSNAWGKRPAKVGISNQPLIQYPDVTGGMTADLNRSIGQYRSGINRLAAEKGLGADVKIGAEANVLNADLKGRGIISDAANTNKIAEINANSLITGNNIDKQYAANIADTTRNDANVAAKAGLFSLGLTNLGKIGDNYAKGMIGLNNAANTEGATYDALKANYALAVQAGYDKSFEEYWKLVTGGGDDYKYTPSNLSATIANLADKTTKTIGG